MQKDRETNRHKYNKKKKETQTNRHKKETNGQKDKQRTKRKKKDMKKKDGRDGRIRSQNVTKKFLEVEQTTFKAKTTKFNMANVFNF